MLADFGIARGLDGATLTTSEVLVGSPSYIAPERAHGEPGGPGSDLWSLGATLYAAVEGRPPYQREGAVATLAAVVTQDPDPPRHAGPAVAGHQRPAALGIRDCAWDRRQPTRCCTRWPAAGDPAGTAPLVAATRPEAPAAVAAAAASQPDPGTLRSAEQTRAFHRAGPPTATAGQEAGAVASSPAAAPAGRTRRSRALRRPGAGRRPRPRQPLAVRKPGRAAARAPVPGRRRPGRAPARRRWLAHAGDHRGGRAASSR